MHENRSDKYEPTDVSVPNEDDYCGYQQGCHQGERFPQRDDGHRGAFGQEIFSVVHELIKFPSEREAQGEVVGKKFRLIAQAA